MENRPDHATISIKINGKERPFVEENIVSEDRLLTNASLKEVSAAEECEESFDWVLPDNVPESPKVFQWKVDQKANKKKLKTKFKKTRLSSTVVASVVLGILIGTSFGFIMLKMLITDMEVVKPDGKDIPTVASEKKSNSFEHVTVPAMETYIVQGGVFSSKEAASTIEKVAKGQNIPTSIFMIGEKVYLFLGVANTLDHAKLIGSSINDMGVEVYAKTFSIPEKTVKEISMEEKKFLDNFPEIVQALTNISTELSLFQTIPANDLAYLTNLSDQIKNYPFSNEELIIIQQDISKIVSDLKVWQETKSKDNLLKMQESILMVLNQYIQL